MTAANAEASGSALGFKTEQVEKVCFGGTDDSVY